MPVIDIGNIRVQGGSRFSLDHVALEMPVRYSSGDCVH